MYNFEIRTFPDTCDPKNPSNDSPIRKAAVGIDGGQSTDLWGANLRALPAKDAFTEHPENRPAVVSKIIFEYPEDERLKRLSKAEASRERRQQEDAEELLQSDQTYPHAPCPPEADAAANKRFAFRGDENLRPDSACSNGYSTAISYRGGRRKPVVLKIMPDGKEGTADSTIRSDRPDDIVVMGVPHYILVRDGDTVGEIANCQAGCAFEPRPITPVTGTTSHYVKRVTRKPRQ
jgi:type IV secretory pathway VirB9-like protein